MSYHLRNVFKWGTFGCCATGIGLRGVQPHCLRKVESLLHLCCASSLRQSSNKSSGNSSGLSSLLPSPFSPQAASLFQGQVIEIQQRTNVSASQFNSAKSCGNQSLRENGATIKAMAAFVWGASDWFNLRNSWHFHISWRSVVARIEKFGV